MPVRVLVIEDNPAIATHLARGLEDEGHLVHKAANAAEGQWLAVNETFDAIILDIMLPDLDGVQLCGTLRKHGVRTPILMLTALGATNDKIRALDAGADEHVVKPVHLGELGARLRALQRRGEPNTGAVIRFEDLELNMSTRQVSRGGRGISLRPKEFSLLEYLLRHPERVLTRAEIGERVWDMHFDTESNVIEVYISILRKKLGDPPLIQTVTGVGYRFTSPDRPGP
jgi:DNA-binding response OmpR family regulator